LLEPLHSTFDYSVGNAGKNDDPMMKPEVESPKVFEWKKNWYPMAFSKTTDKTGPSRVELFGEPIVLWYKIFECLTPSSST
jgi:hypothetical protein